MILISVVGQALHNATTSVSLQSVHSLRQQLRERGSHFKIINIITKHYCYGYIVNMMCFLTSFNKIMTSDNNNNNY